MFVTIYIQILKITCFFSSGLFISFGTIFCRTFILLISCYFSWNVVFLNFIKRSGFVSKLISVYQRSLESTRPVTLQGWFVQLNSYGPTLRKIWQKFGLNLQNPKSTRKFKGENFSLTIYLRFFDMFLTLLSASSCLTDDIKKNIWK